MPRMNILLCLAIIGLSFILNPVDLRAQTIWQSVGIASSPNPVGSGARALGMGGAFIGVADDATAASWNPAGIIQLETPELSVVGEYVQRTDSSYHPSWPDTKSEISISQSSLNYFSFSYPFALLDKNMVVSINYQRLYDFKRDLDYNIEATETNPGLPPFIPPMTITNSQHITYNQDGDIGAMGIAYAVEMTPQISLGLTLNIWTDSLGFQNGWEGKYSNHSTTTFGSLTSIEDINMSEEYSGFKGLNFNLGALWNVTYHLTLGAVFKSPFKGDLNYENREDILSTDADGNLLTEYHTDYSEEMKLKMPMSYGVGVACRFSDAFTMDMDIYRTDWSNYILTNSKGEEFSPIEASPWSESNVKDTTQVRLGGEYLFINPDKALVIPVRGGVFYDPEPYLDKTRGFYGLSIGSGFGYKRHVFDVVYQLRRGNNLYTGWERVGTGTDNAKSTMDVKQHSFLLSFIYYL